MATTNSPLMSLPIPGVGTEAGPAYAQDVNNCLTIIDGHDHSPGYGTPVSPAGMNINSDLSFIGNNATSVKTVRFSPQSSAPGTASDIGCIFELGVDLYYTDGVGNVVRITQSGAVAGTPGSIANLVSPASASYSSAAKTFTWQSDALTPANMDMAGLVLRNLVASSNGLTLAPPTLTTDYQITLPALPASTLPLSISSSGIMSAAQVTIAQLSTALQNAINAIPPATPPGVITGFGGTVAPSGWLMCDGAAVSRTTYAALYAAIGTANGVGDGSTTFNVPDARGMFLRGVSGTTGNDPDKLTRTAVNGGNAGNAVGSIQGDDFRSHSHNLGAGSGSIAQPAGVSGATPFGTTLPTGGNETRPLNIYVNYLIKT